MQSRQKSQSHSQKKPHKPASAVASELHARGLLSGIDTNSITAGLLQSLPAQGRRWQDFVLDTQAGAAGVLGENPQRQATFQVDGASLGLAYGSTNGVVQGSYRSNGAGEGGSNGRGIRESSLGQSWSGGHGFVISEAAIREIRTEAGEMEANAEESGGGQLDVRTERGTNRLHGQLSFFDRQNNWGAKNPFTQWIHETAQATSTTVPVFTPEAYTPPDHETTWGIGLGDRINHSKLYWYAALTSHERNDPALAMIKHPYLCKNTSCTEITGFFAQPTNDQMQVLAARLGLGSANPVVEGLSKYSPMLETLAGLLGPAPRTHSQWSGFGRLDWKATERQQFMLELSGAHSRAAGGGITSVSADYGSHSFGSRENGREWMQGRWEAYVTPNLRTPDLAR